MGQTKQLTPHGENAMNYNTAAMTKAEIKTALLKMGVTVPADATKADMEILMDRAQGFSESLEEIAKLLYGE
jgi:hypothetical protein